MPRLQIIGTNPHNWATKHFCATTQNIRYQLLSGSIHLRESHGTLSLQKWFLSSDIFENAIALSQQLEQILQKNIPVQLFTDGKFLFDVISKGSRTSEKRTMIYIAADREAFSDIVISDIGLVKSKKTTFPTASQKISTRSRFVRLWIWSAFDNLRTMDRTEKHECPNNWETRKWKCSKEGECRKLSI